MKRFKKVLALVLAGVLALAMLTACGETDPDKIIPADQTVYNAVTGVNNAAFNEKGYPPLTYSVKYSEVTQKLLNNWVEYNASKKTADDKAAYQAKYDEIVKELGDVKIVVGLTDRNDIPDTIGTNPEYTSKASASYKTLVNQPDFELGNRIGVATYTYQDKITKIQLVCVFRAPNQ